MAGREDFNAYLSREYLQYSRDLANRYNWRDSDHFAKKGLRAINNREIYPEVPEYWSVNSSKIEEVSVARKRLELLLNPKTKQALPIQLAHLTMLYDCWIANEHKPWSIGSLSRCQTRFLMLIDEAEEYMANVKPKKRIKIIKIKEPEFRKFDIYFDFNSYKFNSDANKELIDLLDYLEKENGNFRIILSGNADRRGNKIYNANLARRRVLAVQNSLTKNGVPKDLIEIRSDGETSPEIITKDNKRNKYNRLVGIYILKGADAMTTIPLPLIDSYIYEKEIKNMKKNKGLDLVDQEESDIYNQDNQKL
jgi:outer membrane protein OmpA-like peptidoglycan-associated protein